LSVGLRDIVDQRRDYLAANFRAGRRGVVERDQAIKEISDMYAILVAYLQIAIASKRLKRASLTALLDCRIHALG
jgi:hypothetical protein